VTTISATFGKPFRQQVAAFRLRLGDLRGTRVWTDLWQAEHDRAFMVAGAMRADILADLAAMVDRAISEGTGLQAFRKDFRAMIAAKGWQISPAGQGTKGGEAWRTRLIYRTNMATSYAAGRFAQLVEDDLPFWVYRHGGSLEPRAHHLAWDGLILPPDHPFWATHAPPNGWGCSCRITGARSIEAAKRVGGKPGLKLPANWQAIDPRTGAPIGIDKGWAYAPGGSVVETVTALSAKLDALPSGPSIDLIQSWLRMDAFATWLQAPVQQWPIARVTDAVAEALGAQTRIAKLSAETALKQLRDHPELTGLDYLMVQRVIDQATVTHQDSATSMIFILADPGDAGYVLVVKATLSGKEMFLQSFRRLSGNEVRRDREISRLLNKGQ
jgi:hypothetical protein